MIKVKINKSNDYVNYIKIIGHANYDDYGKDIVCASVSSIVLTCCNLSISLDKDSIRVEQGEGLMEINILKNDAIINKVFDNMLSMLEELSKQYKNNIKII